MQEAALPMVNHCYLICWPCPQFVHATTKPAQDARCLAVVSSHQPGFVLGHRARLSVSTYKSNIWRSTTVSRTSHCLISTIMHCKIFVVLLHTLYLYFGIVHKPEGAMCSLELQEGCLHPGWSEVLPCRTSIVAIYEALEAGNLDLLVQYISERPAEP